MDESHIITKAEFDASLQNISQETHNDIEAIGAWICSSTDPYNLIWPFRTGFYIHDGQYHIKDDYFDGVMQFPDSIGRNFTEEEYASGAAVAIVAVGSAPQVITETYYDANGNAIGHKVERGDKYKIGDTLVFDNKEYEIIAIAGGNMQMSYPSLPDTTYIADFSVEFTRPPTAAQYQEVLDAFAPLMDRVSITDYEPFYTEDFWLYNTIMLVAVLIAVVAAFNLVVLYQYILMKRQKALAVLQICGCTKWRAICTYCLESILITIPSYCLSAAGFHYLLLPLLKKPFPFIRTAYSLKLYGISNPDDSMANVMVNESSGYHVGDIIALPYESGPETVDLRVAGVYDERAKLLLLNGAVANAEIRDYRLLLCEVDSIQPDSAWNNDTNSLEEIQKKGQLNIFMSTTEAEKYFTKNEHLANGWVGVVTYEDGLTIDEKAKNDEMLRVAFRNPTISPTSDAMLENSYNYAMEQVYALVPVLVSVLVLFVISMISVNSVSAVRKQRTYMVYRICGLQWQRCVWITGIKAAFNAVCAIAICFVLMYIKQKYNLFDELLIATGWRQVAFCLLFAIINIIFAMSISSVILRRAEIRKILKES